MTRLSLAVCALALATVAASPAQASFKVIKWSSGFCQVWDNGIPTMPFPPDWRRVSRNHKTWTGAYSAKMRLMHRHVCTF